MGEHSTGPGGHRQRLRSRFIRSGLEGLQDYEAVELLLTYAIPRRDVKPLAKLLLERFGNLTGILHATGNELLSVPGVGTHAAVLILLMREMMTKSLEEQVREKPVIDTRRDICNFLRMKIGSDKKEALMIFYLDAARHIIEYDISQGTVDYTAVYTREITERALLCRACGIILAHNHPSGSKEPSPEDIRLTRHLQETLKRLNIELFDHVIVTCNEVKSFIDSGDGRQLPAYAAGDLQTAEPKPI